MSTEIVPTDTIDSDIASTIAATTGPDGANETKLELKPRKAQRKRVDGEDDDSDDEAKPARMPVSAELKKVMSAEDGDMRDVLETIGTDGSFKIVVTRKEPEQARDPVTGRMVKVDGHLKTYMQKIDPEFISSRHGGGRFELKFLKKAADGSFKIHTKRVVDIAGDPRTDDVPRNVEPSAVSHASSATSSESPSIVKDVLSVMKDQLDKANDRASHDKGTPATDPMFLMILDNMRAEKDAMREEMRQMRADLAAERAIKPVETTKEDAFKDGLVKQLLDGDSTRLQAVRMQYESEIRILRESHRDDEKRMNDRFDRQLAEQKAQHEREITFIKSSHDTQLASFKISLDTSKEVLNGQLKSLTRDNEQLREEVKELRAKKDKSPLEMAKEVKTFKEVFGDDDSKNESSTVEQVVAALPQAIEVAQGIINRNKPQQQPQQQAQQPQRPQLVRDGNGNTFQVRGGELVPLKKKGQKVAVQTQEGAPPQEVEIPAIDPQKLEMAIAYLERAYSGNQEPEVVAQSARPVMPEEILQSIHTLGIDVFFAKVAKLPSASPLNGQAGKNWIRKVGKALVGE